MKSKVVQQDNQLQNVIPRDKIVLNQSEKLHLQIICLSASANKLLNIQKQAEEYAALIMEELDPDHLGYIMVNNLQNDLKIKFRRQFIFIFIFGFIEFSL